MTQQFKPGDIVYIAASKESWRVRSFDEGDQIYNLERIGEATDTLVPKIY